LPAHPWTVAAYARWCESRHRHPLILTRIRSIARVHLLACLPSPHRHPTVTQTLRVLELRRAVRDRRLPAAASVLAPELAGDLDTALAAADAASPIAGPPAARRRTRTMRSTPRLVSVRPGDS
jgi:hypothetical protein